MREREEKREKRRERRESVNRRDAFLQQNDLLLCGSTIRKERLEKITE